MPSFEIVDTRPFYRLIIAGNFRDGQYHQAKAVAEQIIKTHTPQSDEKKPDGQPEFSAEYYPLTPFDWDNDTYWCNRWPEEKRKLLADRKAKAIILVEQWPVVPLWYQRVRFVSSPAADSTTSKSNFPIGISCTPVQHDENQKLWIGESAEFATYASKQFQLTLSQSAEELQQIAASQWSEWIKQQVPKRSVVGLQISINDKAVGELLIQLYDDICPRTTRNFLLLSKGGQLSKDDGKSLGYRDSCFHRLVHDGFIQGGDVDGKFGKGGQSIYGKHFADESFNLKHRRGTVSMANSGPHSNNSQFFLCMKALPTFDGNFVAFGQIIDGDYVLRKMNDMPVKYPEHPSQAVKITDCSVIYNSFE